MNPVAKALWFVESRYTEQLTLDDVGALDDVAQMCGVSRYHPWRAFGIAVGRSPIPSTCVEDAAARLHVRSPVARPAFSR